MTGDRPRSFRHRTVAISSGCLPLSDASMRRFQSRVGSPRSRRRPTEVSHQTFIPGWSLRPRPSGRVAGLHLLATLMCPHQAPVEVESRACELRRNTPAGVSTEVPTSLHTSPREHYDVSLVEAPSTVPFTFTASPPGHRINVLNWRYGLCRPQ
jgi:hypothetical protein